MNRHGFRTVPEELLEHADAIADHLAELGYRVRIEHSDLGYPSTPAMVCVRQRTSVVVLIDSVVTFERLDDWVRFARSAGRDTRIAVCLPDGVVPTQAEEQRLRADGIGLYGAAPGHAIERIPALDLALNVQLPELKKLPPKLRVVLGPAYDQFRRSNWREGFEDACRAFEEEARRHLKRWWKSGRLIVLKANGQPDVFSNRKVDKMTMGQLAQLYSRIQNKGKTEAVVAKALSKLNRDRIGVVHHKGKAVTERRLRTNVGQHMWSVVAALKELLA
jgi:hypothetical protein